MPSEWEKQRNALSRALSAKRDIGDCGQPTLLARISHRDGCIGPGNLR
jgi:hypothetical protein